MAFGNIVPSKMPVVLGGISIVFSSLCGVFFVEPYLGDARSSREVAQAPGLVPARHVRSLQGLSVLASAPKLANFVTFPRRVNLSHKTAEVSTNTFPLLIPHLWRCSLVIWPLLPAAKSSPSGTSPSAPGQKRHSSPSQHLQSQSYLAALTGKQMLICNRGRSCSSATFLRA